MLFCEDFNLVWTLVNPGLTRGILIILAKKGILSTPMFKRVMPRHYICSRDPMERKWYFWGSTRKSRTDKIRFNRIESQTWGSGGIWVAFSRIWWKNGNPPRNDQTTYASWDEEVEVSFVVMEAYSPYTTILARPWLHAIGAVSSTLHLKVKYPTPGRVGELVESQVVARQCLVAAVEQHFLD